MRGVWKIAETEIRRVGMEREQDSGKTADAQQSRTRDPADPAAGGANWSRLSGLDQPHWPINAC
jgi:hypothetical protein